MLTGAEIAARALHAPLPAEPDRHHSGTDCRVPVIVGLRRARSRKDRPRFVTALRRAAPAARALPGKVTRHLASQLTGAWPDGASPHGSPEDRWALAEGERPLVVASYNVHKCVGTDRRFDPERVLRVIGEMNADLVALQEADRRFGRRSGLLDGRALERETGLRFVPVSELLDGHGWHGNALLIRGGEVLNVRRLRLPGAEPRGAVLAELEFPAGKLRVVATHLGLLRSSRQRQGATILHALSTAEPMPTLMMGDLNEWRPRRSVLRMVEPFFGRDRGGPASFPSRRPLLALDRMLGWPFGMVGTVRAHASALSRVASDHLPLCARLDLAGAHRALTPDPGPVSAARPVFGPA